VQAGEAKLAALKEKDNAAGFAAAQTISRAKSKGVDPAVFLAAMKADSSKLPAYAGVALPDQGYSVLRVIKVTQPKTIDQAKRQAEKKQIEAALAQQEMLAYIEVLKQKGKVEILHPVTSAPAPVE
jgi:peptidyl-prolyl cis-trans isomerase D